MHKIICNETLVCVRLSLCFASGSGFGILQLLRVQLQFSLFLTFICARVMENRKLKKKQEQEGSEIAELQEIFTYLFPFILKMYLTQEYPSSLR